MPVDTITKDPERIRSVAEVDNILTRISAYEKAYEQTKGKKVCAGVLLVQNRTLGAIYYIKSQEEAEKEINKPVLSDTCEWGIEFYPRSYYEELREELNGDRTN